MRAHVLLLVVAAVAAGGSARAAEDPAAEEPAPEPCTASRACALRLGRGHVCEAGRCKRYFDRQDMFGALGMRQGAPPTPQPYQPLVAAIPVIGYSPSSGLLFGLAGQMGMVLGDPADTTISNATGILLYTTKSQFIAQIAATALTSGNRWELLSDWRFLLFNQNTYGLGTGTSPLSDDISLGGLGTLAALPAQPMDFDLVRIHQSLLRRVGGSFYLGLGYRLDRYYGIVDKSLDLSAAPPAVTSHYAYSVIEGFDPHAYTASGLGLEATQDSRDSTIAAYRGWYANLRFTGYPTWLGSTQASTMIAGEGRAYLGLSYDDPRNLLAFWVLGAGVTSGKLPYLALPASGWDARSTSGRGYVQGRFRGTAEVYAEVEWRFRVSADGFWGGTVFANAQTFSRPAVSLPAYGYSDGGERLFDVIKPAGGIGLRVMLVKQSRTALRLDVAVSPETVCFYLGAGEAF
jgi:hypothetical protein